ncbi:glycoside hydrolase 5 family protein [Mucilaginibacter gracilis]|nr:hypothetical protein [Mucilaginibacter gracilis]
MKQFGFNTIKYYGPCIYDHNILKAAHEQGLKVNYSFWIPDDLAFLSNKDAMDNLSAKVIRTVNNLHNNHDILAWELGNTPLQTLSLYYYKPDLLYKQDEYIRWLQTLVSAIKKADPARAVCLDVRVDNSLVSTTEKLHQLIPQIDFFGLVADQVSAGAEQIGELKVPYFYSYIDALNYLKFPESNTGAFITNWQDEETYSFVTFNGLKDKWGRNKFELRQLANRWQRLTLPRALPPVRILVPAVTTVANTALTYHAIINHNGLWGLAGATEGLEFKWVLVKVDAFDNALSMKFLGTGPQVTVSMPENPIANRLYLYVSRGNDVQIIKSKLGL